MKDTFSECHPAVNFFYFALVIAFAMCLTHPLCLALSLAAGSAYTVLLRGRHGFCRQLGWLLPTSLLAAVLNPIFSHQGVTILCYLSSGNPLTLESILYGLAAGGILCVVFLWFCCYSDVLTTDKFIYLFGRVIPALSLVLSMILRFIPRFKAQLKTVAQAQKHMGRDEEKQTLRRRLKDAMQVFSIMVTWSLESAIDTADSMKCRGYGEPGRTAFSLYRMDGRDRTLLLWLSFCALYLIGGAVAGGFAFAYYPSLQGVMLSPLTASFFAVYGLLLFTPILLHMISTRQHRSDGKEVHCHE